MSDRKIVDVHCGWGPTPTTPHWNDAAFVQKSLSERGIVEAFLSSNLARRFDPVAGNDRVAELAETENRPCNMKGWLVTHPAQTPEALEQMREYLGKPSFVGAAMYYDYRNDRPVLWADAREILSAFRRYGKTLLIEVPNFTAAQHAAEIIQQMQGIKVMISGMGGDDWKQTLDLCHRPPAVSFDISGTLDPAKLEYGTKVMGGTRKMMFASGAPTVDPVAVMGMIEDANLSTEDRERLYRGSADRLFGEKSFVELA